MHIPKTAGATLSTVLRRQFPPSERFDHIAYRDERMTQDKLVAEARVGVKCVLGHYLYGIHENFPSPHAYFTMLREPVERILSMYSYHKTQSHQMWARDATLAEFLVRHGPATNRQTAYLCGLRCSPDLEKAKENLRSFAAVGITERFDDSLRLFQRTFCWADVSYERTNETIDRLRREDVSPKDIKSIEKRNELDAELYALAKDLLVEQL